MLFRSVTSAALVAFAAQAVAEQMPYKLAKMSIQDLGLVRRQTEGYQPEQTQCGAGTTCAEACGAGFEQCGNNAATISCYNPTVKQVCCPNANGDSCDDGYYCTSDPAGVTWCCPNGMNLGECAAAYSVTGALVSQTAKPTTSSTTAAPSTTAVTSTSLSHNETTTTTTSSKTTTYTVSNSTTSTTTPAGTTTRASITPVPTSAASSLQHISALVLLGAGAFALLL